MGVLFILSLLIMLCPCLQTLPSNPDSEMVQDSSSDGENTEVQTSTPPSLGKYGVLNQQPRTGKFRFPEDYLSDFSNSKIDESPLLAREDWRPFSYRNVALSPSRWRPQSNRPFITERIIGNNYTSLKSFLDEESANQSISQPGFKPNITYERNHRNRPPTGFNIKSNQNSDRNIYFNVENKEVGDKETPKLGAIPFSEKEFLSGIINDFSFKLMKEINPTYNFVMSPVSVYVALAMAYLASHGETKMELEKAMVLTAYGKKGYSVHEGITNVLLSTHKKENFLYYANGMLVSKDFPVNPKYKEDLQMFYGASVKNVDFTDGDAIINIINKWVAQNTRNAIPKFATNPPSPKSRLIFLSTIYFKGTWKTQFPSNLTYHGEFFQTDGKNVMVPMMALYGEEFPYFHDKEKKYSFVKLPYVADKLSMIIALPDDIRGEPNIEMSDEVLCNLLDEFETKRLDSLHVPKFHIEFTRPLKTILRSMGIRKLFDHSFANLTGLSDKEGLYVTSFVHKAVVDVNEEGSVASAITQASLMKLALEQKLEFRASHPFSFYILNEKIGLILFSGKVYNPNAGIRPINQGPVNSVRTTPWSRAGGIPNPSNPGGQQAENSQIRNIGR